VGRQRSSVENALAMSDAGAAVVIIEKELSGEKLFGVIDNILRDGEKLRRLEENSARLGKVEAAATIVDASVQLVTKRINIIKLREKKVQ